MIALTDNAKAIAEQLRSVLGVPCCQIVINYSDNGKVQSVEPRLMYRTVADKTVPSVR